MRPATQVRPLVLILLVSMLHATCTELVTHDCCKTWAAIPCLLSRDLKITCEHMANPPPPTPHPPTPYPPLHNAAFIYLDRYEAASTRSSTTQRAADTVLIQSDTLLTKPLVLGLGVTIQVAAGATLTLAAQPVLPRQQVGGGAVSLPCQAARAATQAAADMFGQSGL